MKLSFRGAKYDYHPTEIEVTEGSVGGVYRGAPWKTHQLRQHPRLQPKPKAMTYRGVHYHQG